jgi:UPF0755 protein
MKGDGLGKFLGFLLVFLLLVVGALGGAYFYADSVYRQAGPATADGSPRTVIIEPKSSVPAIAKKLVGAGAIRNDLVFRGAVRLTNATMRLKAGEYAFDSGESMKGVIEQMIAHKVVLHGITAPEGLTSAMIMEKLKNEPLLSGPLPSVEPAEGVLLPDTYMVERGQKRADVVARMISAQQKLMAELWPRRQAGLPFETPEQALILASVVEKETGLPDERPQVAAVFVNRLKRGMKLESDPTIIYGLTKGAPLGHGLTRSELNTPNAWSTYQIAGLPPTPICNPGRAAIEAVLNPPVSDALYFVAQGGAGGRSTFSATYAEHMKNVANLRSWEHNAAKAAAAADNQGEAPTFEASTPPPKRVKPSVPAPPKPGDAS